MSAETECYEQIKRENELKEDEGGVSGRGDDEEEVTGKKSHCEG